jgi:hypothetical protein
VFRLRTNGGYLRIFAIAARSLKGRNPPFRESSASGTKVLDFDHWEAATRRGLAAALDFRAYPLRLVNQ